MIVKNCIYRILLPAIFCFLNTGSTAQNVGIRTDRSSILIGERIVYELLINLPTRGYSIHLDIPRPLPHFDVIQESKIDTTVGNGRFSMHQKIIFTSFDSGSWYIPSFPVTLVKNNIFKKYMTDSVRIDVGYSPSDSTGQLRDIKPIIEVDTENYFWYYVAGIALLFVILLAIVYKYFKNRKKKPLPVLHSNLSPYDEALKRLEALSQYKLADQKEVKLYHTELSEIILRYFSRITGKNLLNKTTSEFLLELREKNYSTTFIASVAEAMRMGDAVKFAKFIPPVSESRNMLTIIKQAIEYLEKSKPST